MVASFTARTFANSVCQVSNVHWYVSVLLLRLAHVMRNRSCLCSTTAPHRACSPTPAQRKSTYRSRKVTTAFVRTRSQSSFERVMGSARRRPLNVFSLMFAYVSFSDAWYFPSSASINARILLADGAAGEDVIAGGSTKSKAWLVESCTCT